MKKTILILLMLVTTTALTQALGQTVWNNVVVGYAKLPIISVEKVAFYSDRTEVSLLMKLPEHVAKQAAGQEIPMPTTSTLKAGGKDYALKDATGITLGKPYKVPADGQIRFSLSYEPIPSNTWMIDRIDFDDLQLMNIRDLDTLPTGITDTYWRNEATGDWLIGFTQKHVIYDNKVWDIVSQTAKNDAYTLTLAGGPTVKVGKLKKGLRTITVTPPLNSKLLTLNSQLCSPITATTLPDYPTKDLRKGFADNGYAATDSVTIVGWLKDMPGEAWKKGREFEVNATNIFLDDQQKFYATMDSLGRFTLRIPVINSTTVYLDLGRTSATTVLEPGKTYFFLNDFKTGQQLMMGDDVRLQNELLTYPDKWNYARIPDNTDAMQFKVQTDSICDGIRAALGEHLALRPNLSQRYIDYINGCCVTGQGEAMMQARYHLKYKLPKEYMDFVTNELWQKAPQPYTLYRPFTTFMRDYVDHTSQADCAVPAGNFTVYLNNHLYSTVLRQKRAEGKVAITDEELALCDRYAKELKAHLTRQYQARAEAGATKSDEVFDIDSVAAQQFNQQDWVLRYNDLVAREDIARVLQEEAPFFELYKIQKGFSTPGADPTLKELALAQHFYRNIDQTRSPLAPAMHEYLQKEVRLPAALAALAVINTLNDRYAALERQDFANAASLRPSTDVEGMTDGEKIFRKIIEPFKGRIVYLDIWGTWCGPCKRNLKESWKVKEALKDYDIVYLYLANRSSDESWKNVIKEYNLTGPNCVHYNLPEDQQAAVEHYVGINGYPTYKLIDKEGNIHDLHWLHHEDMNSFKETIDKLNK